jgi:hypothetical protein
MPETTNWLPKLGDLGVTLPVTGDSGDRHVRAALAEAIDGNPRSRRRLRLPFGTRTVALMPAALVVTVATAAAAGTISLLNTSPMVLFQHNPGARGVPHTPVETVIPSTVHRIATFHVAGLGRVQYWVGATRQHGLCQAMRLPNRTWAVLPGSVGSTAGTMPGCGPARKQQVLAQGNGPGLAPTSVDEQSISLKNRDGEWFDVYYGIVDADAPAGVKDPANGRTAPLIQGRYFVLVAPLGRFHKGMCMGCAELRAINSAGHFLPANYGPAQFRNH